MEGDFILPEIVDVCDNHFIEEDEIIHAEQGDVGVEQQLL